MFSGVTLDDLKGVGIIGAAMALVIVALAALV
jgi:hypothetical protein